VDGIVKGLRVPGWPTDGWQALHRLALQLCHECAQGKNVRGTITA
jgi:DNA polymerase-3 subunit delta